jgi:hypothetical protein
MERHGIGGARRMKEPTPPPFCVPQRSGWIGQHLKTTISSTAPGARTIAIQRDEERALPTQMQRGVNDDQ